jgi:hypothetical protein
VNCPKCAAPYDAADAECPRCGVVFAKLAQRRAPVKVDAGVPSPAPVVAVDSRERASTATRVARGLTIAGLALWTWSFASKPLGVGAAASVLHLPNLIFHEAGHVILGMFGRFITVLGGSLFQFALPLILAGAFLRQRDPFAAAVCTWWAGQNLIDVAPYIADSRALQLVLIGGRTGAEVEGHDWEYLLTQMNLLHKDRAIGSAVHWTGIAMMVASLVWAGFSIARARRPDEE